MLCVVIYSRICKQFSDIDKYQEDITTLLEKNPRILMACAKVAKVRNPRVYDEKTL